MPRDDDDSDELEIERKPAMPKGEWILGMCGIGAILLFAFALGVSLGQSRSEPKSRIATEVAHTEMTKPSAPEAEPTKPEPPKLKPEPKKPKTEPTKPKAEPTKLKTDPTKPEPKKTEPTGTPVLFGEKIGAIFKFKCIVCHGDPSIKGGLDLRTLASIGKGGDNGTAVAAKDLEKSYLWGQIESGAMPPAGKDKLTAVEIKLIKDWILSGGN